MFTLSETGHRHIDWARYLEDHLIFVPKYEHHEPLRPVQEVTRDVEELLGRTLPSLVIAFSEKTSRPNLPLVCMWRAVIWNNWVNRFYPQARL